MPKKSDKSPKSVTILLAEDDVFLIRIYQTKLELAGYKTILAMDGERALSLIKKHQPDLILSKIVLPKINGFDLVKKIKKNKKLAHVPIIFLTNLSSQEDVKKAFALGVDDYLIKAHHTPDEVIQKIKSRLSASAPTTLTAIQSR